jgi:hypothetical protein
MTPLSFATQSRVGAHPRFLMWLLYEGSLQIVGTPSIISEYMYSMPVPSITVRWRSSRRSFERDGSGFHTSRRILKYRVLTNLQVILRKAYTNNMANVYYSQYRFLIGSSRFVKERLLYASCVGISGIMHRGSLFARAQARHLLGDRDTLFPMFMFLYVGDRYRPGWMLI